MKQKTVTYQLALVVMVFFWGLTFPLSKISLFSVDTMPLLTLRFLLGAATVFLVIGIRERKKKTFWKIVLNPVALRGGLIVGLVAGLGMILQVGGMAYTCLLYTSRCV